MRSFRGASGRTGSQYQTRQFEITAAKVRLFKYRQLTSSPPSQSWAASFRPERNALAALGGRDVTGGDLVFVGGKGCQDFGLLGLRDLEEVQGPSKFGCDLIELGR
jgi:hypothetical protein